MKLLHTSDWHLGKRTPGIENYRLDQAYFISQLAELIKTERVDAVLCAGDVYDSARVSAEDVQLYSDAASEICLGLKCSLITIAGNHDSAERLSACDRLLAKAGLHIRGRLAGALSPILLGGGEVAVYALPFFQPAEAAFLFPEAEIHSMSDAVNAVLSHIRESMDVSRINILMAHLSVSGAELSESDRSAINANAADGHTIGGASGVRPELFYGFDYVALGHIHKPQRLGRNVYYSGAPIAYSFGREEAQVKGVFIYDTESREALFRPITPLHPRRSIKRSYSEALALEGLSDAYLKLTITDRINSMELRSEMERRFPLLMELYGVESRISGESTLISAADVKQLSARDILQAFIKDSFDAEPEDDLIDMFINLYEAAEKEDDK